MFGCSRLIIVNLVSLEEGWINRNVDRITICSTPGEFLDRSFFHIVYNFSRCQNSSSWGTVLAQTLTFSFFRLQLKFFSVHRPSQSGPGQEPQWSWSKNHFTRCWKVKSNANYHICIIFYMLDLNLKKTTLMEAGTGQKSCHPSSTGEKWLSPLLTPALVVPCWWDQLTMEGVLFCWIFMKIMLHWTLAVKIKFCPVF